MTEKRKDINMTRKYQAVVGLIVATFIALTIAIETAIAAPGSLLAGGSWHYEEGVIATDVPMRYASGVRWLQLITNGIKIDRPTRLCHDFAGEKYGWQGEIRRKKRGKWIAIPSVLVAPVSDEPYQICVDAPIAGTYALFANLQFDGEEAQKPEIARYISGNSVSGHWNTGTEYDIDLKNTPPPAWLQFFSRGVEIEYPTKICHPFEKGQLGWQGEIRYFSNNAGQWTKVESSSGYADPVNQSQYQVCADAPYPGKYALFGFLQN